MNIQKTELQDFIDGFNIEDDNDGKSSVFKRKKAID